MDEAKIRKVIEQKQDEEDYNDCYLVDIEYNKPNNHLVLYIGSDSGMTLRKCQAFSRHVEAYLDEDLMLGPKYELNVSSPGLDRPLKLKRQYQNNVGRDLKVKLKDGSRVKGELLEVGEEEIQVQETKYKKVTGNVIQIPFDQIETAFIQIKF